MKFKLLFIICLVAILGLSSAFLVQGGKPYRAFSITLPQVVDVTPGEEVIINGSILNFGQNWLHDFNINVTGLPSDYNVTITPSHFTNLRILRDWSAARGVFLVPEKFNISITAPAGSSGSFTVNVTGQEHMSRFKVSNSTSFILRGKAATPQLSISDIVVPETVTEFEPFNITFDVDNIGSTDQFVNLSVTVPSDWSVEPSVKSLTVKGNGTESVVFSITPTNSSGEISVLLLYPYREQILNITKVGPTLIPQTTATIPAPISLPSGLFAWLGGLKNIPTWLIVVIIVFLIIIVWNLYKILKTYSFKLVREKPEEMKKQADLPVV